MKKLLLIFLFLSNYSIAYITSIDERFTLLCQDGITNISKCIFKNRNGQYHQVEETNEIYYDYKS